MENMFALTPLQSFVVLAINTWIFVIFPVIVIRKLNYLTTLLESQFEQNDQET